MSQRTADVVIVGAGIVGAACAASLAAEGLSVTVVEAIGVGTGVTAAGMGHLVVMDDSEAQFALTRYSLELWKQLADELPADVELDRCGTLWVAADEDEMQAVRRKHKFYVEHGVATEILDHKQLAEAEPNLRPGLAGALRVPGDCVVYPPTAARWLMDRAIARGAQLVAGEVIELSGGHARLRDGTVLSAAYTVNAAGIGSPRLTPGIEVRPRKGHLVITDRYPGFVRHQLVELGYLKSAHGTAADSVAFNVQPRKTGQLLIGSSRQYGSEDPAIDHAILGRMIERAVEYMPGLAGLSAIRAWTGFRPSTPDKLPLIGPSEADGRLILASGHEGLGITTSLGTGRRVADNVVGRMQPKA
ncbi:MAG TPA: FAD-dependent oxidoreductase [Tepidisphaeraceae bacterium]|jgi:glycine/D-amino acid oxidase-like deaminating enzyme